LHPMDNRAAIDRVNSAAHTHEKKNRNGASASIWPGISNQLNYVPGIDDRNFRTGGQCRTRTCDLLLVSRKEAISSNCCQLLLMPKNQWFLVGRFESDYYLLLLISVQGPRYSPRYESKATAGAAFLTLRHCPLNL
jgi:hypothetical protein